MEGTVLIIAECFVCVFQATVETVSSVSTGQVGTSSDSNQTATVIIIIP